MRVGDILTADHREIDALFDALAPIAGDDHRGAEIMRLVTQLALAIKTHGLAEEKVVYEVIRTANDRLAACALEGPHELHALDIVIDRLLVLRPGPELRAALAVARRLFDQHAHHEEHELIPAMAEALPDDEHELLGHDLACAKQRLRPQIARHIAPLAGPRLHLV